MTEDELRPFIVMMPRLLAERQRELIDALVVAQGRMLKDEAYRGFMRALDQRVEGEYRRQRAPKLSIREMQNSPGIHVIRQDKVAAWSSTSVTSRKPGQRPGVKAREEVSE